ncbi:gypintegrase 1 [Plakobranchus ocellatus]|uniref:Gypintegrase 1 n=1 Tax=Plakobranchus ocellatus TaxID=259542 RepID=A0AAV3ZPQ3_9GAST|nr:gypintegrase 1 [Plakobranchus ocellatus]
MPAIMRAQASKDQADLSTNSLVDKQKLFPEFQTVNLTIEQRSDSTLKPWFSAVGNPPVRGISFDVEDGILFRTFQSSTKNTKTLVVPQSRRSQVLSMAHDSPLSGHTGFRKTLAHIKSEFSWPGMTSDVYQFVRSCHTCQIKAPVGRDRPAPLQSMPPILEPFQRVVIDLVGPLPCTDSKNIKYYVRDGRFEVVASQTAVISQQSASMMQPGDGGLTYPPSGPDSDYAPAHVDSVVEIIDVCSAGVISEEQVTELGCEMTTVPDVQLHSQVLINPDLQPHQREDVHRVLVDFADVLTSRPGHTKTVEYVIRLKSDKVIRMKPYPLPFASQTFVEAEVRNLLDLGVIEPSTSPYCSPIVLVKKKGWLIASVYRF